MNDIVTIGNAFLTVSATALGGTLTSVLDRQAGEELLYQPSEKAWQDRDVIIFPFVARLKDGYYLLDGKRYDMRIHGVARYSRFRVETSSPTAVTLLLTDNAETRAAYPFAFELRVTYAVAGKKLSTTLSVKNPGESALPFMLGGHPGYKLDCDEREGETDTRGNFLRFAKREYRRRTLDSTGCFITGTESLGTLDSLELGKDTFRRYNTLMLDDFEGRLILERRTRRLTFELGRVPVLALWSMPDYGDYVCIEPWFGIPDADPAVRDFRGKALMNELAPGETFTYAYSMEIQ